MSNGQSGATEQTLSTNVYSADRKSRLEELQYGNGGKVKYTYDDFDRVTGITHDNDANPKFTYEYDAKGRAAVVTDTKDGITIRNNYDQTDRPAESEQRDGNGSLKYRTLIEYDAKNRVKAFNEAAVDATHKTEYTYDKDNRATEVKYNGSDSTKVSYTYDKLNRVISRTIANGTAYTTQYGYIQGASAYGTNATTPLVQSITQGSGANALNFAYTYDSRGNITSETRNGVTTTYEYDALGQLTRVNDPNDPTAHNEGSSTSNGTTWLYTYDRGGNILSKAAYAYTTGTVGTAVRTWLYEYTDANWKDKLTKFDGNTITYDAIGNPLSDGTWTYTWQAGRQLKSMSKVEGNNTITMEFTYNHAGLRTKKVKKVNGVVAETTEYMLNGKNVVDLIHTNQDTNEVNKLHFYYDAQGRVALVDFNGTLYSYTHNLQGDIIGILNTNGNMVVEYKYDAWGKPISTTADSTLKTEITELNPFRYRGYVWDKETELYYLKSRYFIPTHSLFLNADIYIDLRKMTPFIYCHNEPNNYKDPSGFSDEHDTIRDSFFRYSLSHLSINAFLSNPFYTAFLYAEGREIAVVLASIVTEKNNWPITQECFAHFMKGYGKKKVFGNESAIAEAIKKEGGIAQIIKLAYSGSGITHADYEYKDKSSDLYYSIQHVNVQWVYRKSGNQVFADVTVTDRYDFTELRSYDNFVFASIINDLGFIADSMHLGMAYDIEISFTICVD